MCSILLVEDHVDTRRAFAAILRHWGHDVSTSGTVAGGLSFLEDNEVDVLLSDIGLPDRSGIEATREITRAAPDVAVLMLTMFHDDESVFAAMRAGALGYVLKGAEPEQLIRAIQAVRARRHHDRDPERFVLRPGQRAPQLLPGGFGHVPDLRLGLSPEFLGRSAPIAPDPASEWSPGCTTS